MDGSNFLKYPSVPVIHKKLPAKVGPKNFSLEVFEPEIFLDQITSPLFSPILTNCPFVDTTKIEPPTIKGVLFEPTETLQIFLPEFKFKANN